MMAMSNLVVCGCLEWMTYSCMGKALLSAPAVCVSCHTAMKNGKQSATVFIINGISHCVVEPWMESMCLLMLQMKEVNITTTKASIVLS